MNVKTELKTTVSHVLQIDTSGPVIFNANALLPVYPIRDLYLRGTNPAAEQQSIISTRINKASIEDLLRYNNSLSHALSPFSNIRASKSLLQKRRINSDD